MDLRLFGISHKTANLVERESFILSKNHINYITDLLDRKFSNQLSSLFFLSTCNRTECYMICESEQTCRDFFLEIYRMLDSDLDQESFFYFKAHEDAFVHLCQVGSGVDSRIIGEKEIFGQLKNAFKEYDEMGLISNQMRDICERAFTISKFIRHETNIDSTPISISTLVLKLLKELFENPSEQNILLIGAGDVATNIIKNLHKNGFREIEFHNRTKRIISISNSLQLESKPLNKINSALKKNDILISSINSDLPIIGKGLIEENLKLRKNKPLLLIDLGVPRNIETAVSESEFVYLFTLEDIENFSFKNLKERQQSASHATTLIEAMVKDSIREINEDNVREHIFITLSSILRGKNESYMSKLISKKKIADVIIENFDIEDDLASKLTALDNKIVISMIKEISRAS